MAERPLMVSSGNPDDLSNFRDAGVDLMLCLSEILNQFSHFDQGLFSLPSRLAKLDEKKDQEDDGHNDRQGKDNPQNLI